MCNLDTVLYVGSHCVIGDNVRFEHCVIGSCIVCVLVRVIAMYACSHYVIGSCIVCILVRIITVLGLLHLLFFKE